LNSVRVVSVDVVGFRCGTRVLTPGGVKNLPFSVTISNVARKSNVYGLKR